jgi:hypothetical protein
MLHTLQDKFTLLSARYICPTVCVFPCLPPLTGLISVTERSLNLVRSWFWGPPNLCIFHFLTIKVKLSLCFFFLHWASRRGGVLGEWMYSSMHSLTSTLNWGEWSASRPSHFTPRERATGTQWIAGWLGPRAGLEAVAKRKKYLPL